MAGKDFFDQAYSVTDAEGTRALYRDHAADYDATVTAQGYASPGRVARAMAGTVADRAAPLLEVGCGTGLSGDALAEAGFTTIDGTDFSAEMLERARARTCYRSLAQGDLTRPLPADPGQYANVAAIGVFSPGHAPAETIDAVMALLQPGGCFGFTLNDHALEEGAYEARIRALVDAGTAEVAHESYGEHLPGLGLKSKVYVLRRC